MNVLGNRMRAAREALGLSQAELAKALGWHRTEVVSVETGEHANPTAKRIRVLAQKLGVTSDHLLGLDGDARKPRRPARKP